MATPDPILLRNEETLWTVKEVCAYLQASRAWVYKNAEGGTLPCIHLGGFVRFDPVVVRAWVKGQSAKPVAVSSASFLRITFTFTPAEMSSNFSSPFR